MNNFLHLLIILFSIKQLHASDVTSFWQKLFSTNQVQSVAQENQNVLPTSIGILKINGDINSEVADIAIKKIHQFTQDVTISGILLMCDSGGGQPAAAELIFRELKKTVLAKPVVTIVSGLCCSGAYLTVTSSDWIVAPLNANIGSVGVIHTVERHSNTKANNNASYSADIVYESYTAGKFKDIWSAQAKNLNDEKRAFLQAITNEYYDLFVQMVAQARNLNKDEACNWAEGKFFTGKSAFDLKLIDQIGGYSDAVDKLKELMQARQTYLGGPLVFVE